jgi:hypothetical protein
VSILSQTLSHSYSCYFSRSLQPFERDEQVLQQFFENYGPSARDCFAFCEDLSFYREHVRGKIREMTWPTITKALITGSHTLQLNEGSHKVIVIDPHPENREIYVPRIATKTIGSLMSEQDTAERWQNAHNLYQSMRLDPMSKSTAGWLLEPPFHALCVRGTTFQLYPLKLKPGGRTDDNFVNSEYTARESLVLPRQERVVFDKVLLIQSLEPDHYYQPIHGTQASFDSFIYDPTVPRITSFQVTVGVSHDVKTLGLSLLLQLMEQLRLPTPALRFVVVIPEGDQVQCVLPKARSFNLEMFCLEVSEAELFPDPRMFP